MDAGHSVLVIEHNLDVIKTADHIIDLGPEGGDDGGRVVAQGTPEEIVESKTYTGQFLESVLREPRELSSGTVSSGSEAEKEGSLNK